ncbi:hypothetical protein IT575_13955 [bacterium]|nr:hypothetical protein [bacterium]
MPFTIALLLQADDPGNRNLLILGIAIVGCLLVLGLRFFRALFEVITAPQASLGHHGRNDGFMHSLMIVLLGGLIGTLAIFLQMDKVKSGLGAFAQAVSDMVANGASNKNYADVLGATAMTTVNQNVDNYILNNLVLLPLYFVAVWVIVSLLAFAFSKMLGGQATLPGMAGALAYSYFFGAISAGLSITSTINSLPMMAGSTTAPAGGMEILAIIGLVLNLYALVLFLMGISQGGDLTVGATVGVLVFMLIILGGGQYFGVFKAKQAFDGWVSTLQSTNPATGLK